MLIQGCDEKPLNSPYPNEKSDSNVLYSSFSERPKTLDPAKAYSSNEYNFLYQIYEPPLQYHYLKRPYTLTTQTALELPKVEYFDKSNKKINKDSKNVAYTLYTLSIKPNIYYQPHPAFAKTADGQYRYHHLSEEYLDEHDIDVLDDFKYRATRKLQAEDYVYQIKRLASPKINSPIFGLMSEYIWGMSEYSTRLKKALKLKKQVDLRALKMDGVKAIDKTHYQIKLKGKYQQFEYWLAMPFFAPIPWEAEVFYNQPGMEDKNITLAWYPIGTGPYMLTKNNPNREMVLEKNPHYHLMRYPSDGTEKDKEEGLLKYGGERLPFIDKILFSLEKESIPRWNKFLQGYYDLSGVSADSFDGAIRMTKNGKASLTPKMEEKSVRLMSAVEPSIFYMGFNMLDDIVGGSSKRARKYDALYEIMKNTPISPKRNKIIQEMISLLQFDALSF
jgi:ABC-type transport system substrate-binding protein